MREEDIFSSVLVPCHGYGKGRDISGALANHKALGQLTNQSTFRILEGRVSSKQELNSTFKTDWEREELQ